MLGEGRPGAEEWTVKDDHIEPGCAGETLVAGGTRVEMTGLGVAGGIVAPWDRCARSDMKKSRLPPSQRASFQTLFAL